MEEKGTWKRVKSTIHHGTLRFALTGTSEKGTL